MREIAHYWATVNNCVSRDMTKTHVPHHTEAPILVDYEIRVDYERQVNFRKL